MQPLKLLHIAVFAFIITLLISIFFQPKNNNTIQAGAVSIVSEEKSVTIPNIVKINIVNNSSETVTYNPCTDLSISVNSNYITDIDKAYENKCENISIQPNSTAKLNLDPLYRVFASNNFAGQHILTIKNENFGENGKSIVYNLEKPGFFRSLISSIVYQPIYNLFIALLLVLPGHELGWAIVIITIIIRLILLVPQNRMLENSKKMAELNPKIKAIQEEYKDDRAVLGMKLMELYKEEKISPMGSCLPLLIQLPILMALYWIIMWISDVSNFYHLYSFLGHFNPSNINTIFFGQNLLAVGGTIGIIVAIILAGTQWLQLWLSFKNQPKPNKNKKEISKENSDLPALDPQAMQGVMLVVFPIMIGVTGYIFPLGLGLYWWIGLVFMICQQIYVNNKKSPTTEIIKNHKSKK